MTTEVKAGRRLARRFTTWVIVLLGLGTIVGGCEGKRAAPSGTDGGVAADTLGAGPSNEQRAQAASATANSNPSCVAIQPFYWEIGDGSRALVGGTASAVGATSPAADTLMLIASASKWIFGAYVVELRAGKFTANDLAALTMRSGNRAPLRELYQTAARKPGRRNRARLLCRHQPDWDKRRLRFQRGWEILLQWGPLPMVGGW